MLGEGCLPVTPQEILVEAGLHVRPRKQLVTGAMPRDIPVRVQALGVHRVEPAVEREMLAPFLERASVAPYPLDHAPDPAVAARRDAFGEGRGRVVPLELRARALERVTQQLDLARELVDTVLPEPLERRVRLRD